MSDNVGVANNSREITPSDTVRYKDVRGLYVGVSGNVRMEMAGGAVVTRQNMAQGITHGGAIVRVLATGTTATGLILEY